ncbi:hypothetical protein DL98DRAFT_540641 [Cadophora sp. DSE1049]|nr:hypothetical protein DL98DRAFT_540641 [Cadophora sp. DSE1049]
MAPDPRDGDEDFPAKILDIGVKGDRTNILVAYYMLRDTIGNYIHNSDLERWNAVKANWVASGKYYALTNELQYIDISTVNGRNPKLQAEIDPSYVLFLHGTRYTENSRFWKWQEVQAMGVEGWWDIDDELRAFAAARTQDDLRVVEDAAAEHNDMQVDIQDKADDAESTVQATQPAALTDLGQPDNEPALQEDHSKNTEVQTATAIGDLEQVVAEPIAGTDKLDTHPAGNYITMEARDETIHGASSGHKRQTTEELRPPNKKTPRLRRRERNKRKREDGKVGRQQERCGREKIG